MARCRVPMILLICAFTLLWAGVAAADETAKDSTQERSDHAVYEDFEEEPQHYYVDDPTDHHMRRGMFSPGMCIMAAAAAAVAVVEKVIRPDLRYEFPAGEADDEEGTLVLSWPFGFSVLTAQLAERDGLYTCALCYHMRGIFEVQRPLVDEPNWRVLGLSRHEFLYFTGESFHLVGLADGGYQWTKGIDDANGPVAGLGLGFGMAWDLFALRFSISGRSAFLPEQTVHSLGVELAWYVQYRERLEFRDRRVRPFPQFEVY